MPDIATINGIAEDNIATHNGATASTVASRNGDTWVHWGPPETVGTAVVFESAEISYNRVAALSETKAVVVYRDVGNSYYGTACVLDTDGNSVTAGTPSVFSSRNLQGVGITRLSSTTMVIIYMGDGDKPRGRVISVDGTTITLGTESATFYTTAGWSGGVTALSDSLVVQAARDSGTGDKGKVCAGSISGTDLTWGTPVELTGNAADHHDVIKLTATTAIIVFSDSNNTQTAIVATCSGTGGRTISLGTAVVFDGDVEYNSLATFSETKVVVCYRDTGNSSYGTACVLDVSGTSITAGTPTVFNSIDSQYIDCSELNDSNLIALFRQGGSGSKNTKASICVMGVDGTTISPRTAVNEVFGATVLTFSDTTKLTGTKLLVTYEDASNSQYGTTRIIYNS